MNEFGKSQIQDQYKNQLYFHIPMMKYYKSENKKMISTQNNIKIDKISRSKFNERSIRLAH